MAEATTIPSFNPTGNEHVTKIKAMTEAVLVYVRENCKDARCSALAQTNYEQAAMWAVKSFFV